MELKRLLLRQFRNYRECSVEWHPKINLIYGKNAQGKTNLLEAISYLSIGSSFREASDQKLVNLDSDFFFLQAELLREGTEQTICAGYQNRKKLWKKNGVNCRRISEAAGFLHSVVFTPEDLGIVKKGPEQRRSFLNREMLQIFGGYHLELLNYRRALLQRNNLLKQLAFEKNSNDSAEDLLLPWEEQLAASGAAITLKRAEVIERLNKIAAQIHSELTAGAEDLQLQYEPAVTLTADEAGEEGKEGLTANMLELFKERRGVDLRCGYSTAGPHRDDFKITINGIDARSFGSQGQQRTAALAIKLSEMEMVKEINGYYPILLLDDVLSELDQNRRAALLKMALNKAQLFITSTDVDQELLRPAAGSCKKYMVSDGKITQSE